MDTAQAQLPRKSMRSTKLTAKGREHERLLAEKRKPEENIVQQSSDSVQPLKKRQKISHPDIANATKLASKTVSSEPSPSEQVPSLATAETSAMNEDPQCPDSETASGAADEQGEETSKGMSMKFFTSVTYASEWLAGCSPSGCETETNYAQETPRDVISQLPTRGPWPKPPMSLLNRRPGCLRLILASLRLWRFKAAPL
jgi:hypothetical protein